MMDPELKTKWVAALRSGEYTQGRGYLYHPLTNSFCCLGVLCAVAGLGLGEIESLGKETDQEGFRLGWNDEDGDGYESIGDHYGIHSSTRADLMRMNDGKGDPAVKPIKNQRTFAEIADFIEKTKDI